MVDVLLAPKKVQTWLMSCWRIKKIPDMVNVMLAHRKKSPFMVDVLLAPKKVQAWLKSYCRINKQNSNLVDVLLAPKKV